MTVHLVNLTNPMMMKGPFRELIPVTAKVKIKMPENKNILKVHLVMSGQNPKFEISEGILLVDVPEIRDHEIIALDLR